MPSMVSLLFLATLTLSGQVSPTTVGVPSASAL